MVILEKTFHKGLLVGSDSRKKTFPWASWYHVTTGGPWKGFSWCFILFPRLPEMSNFAHRNSFFMSHVISLWLVRTCNLQVLTSRREMSFELKGNANLIRYSDLCISLLITKKIKLPEPGIEPGTFGV